MRAITVVGASLAGLYAARALRDQGYDGRLVVVGDEPHRPYDRPPLSKDFLAGKVEADLLRLEDAEDDLDADWRLGAPAASLDATTREVVLADGSRIESDGVVIATGARARTLPTVGSLGGVHVLRTLDDALALRRELIPGSRLVVIGAGFIGGEVASTARALGLEVTVVEALATPLAGPLGAQMGAVVSALHEHHGVRLRCGTGVNRLVSILKGFEETSTVYVAQAQRWHPEIRRRADDEHLALLDAFRSRDAEKAAEVMRGHAAMPIERTKSVERRSG